jgi:hypothetical protein
MSVENNVQVANQWGAEDTELETKSDRGDMILVPLRQLAMTGFPSSFEV